MITLINANSLKIPLADKSVNCVVTSPPYWALRDYGVDGQIGLEASPFEYAMHLVEVFREVKRVLRDDGTLWVNLGDTYMSQPSWGRDNGTSTLIGRKHSEVPHAMKDQLGRHTRGNQPGLKPKDMVGIPWRVAFALQDDGWYLRSDIVWSKPNAMPESVTDRPTKAHEYLFLLSKNERYFYDAEAIKEPAQEWTGQAATFKRENGKVLDNLVPGQARTQHRPDRKQDQLGKRTYTGFNNRWDAQEETPSTRNKRTVWIIPTEACSYAHFATYPRKLVEPCIKAGCPAGGVVLDPFAGSGTTGIVARALGRHFVGLDLSYTYLSAIARKRLDLDALEAWTEGIQTDDSGLQDLPLFNAQPVHAEVAAD